MQDKIDTEFNIICPPPPPTPCSQRSRPQQRQPLQRQFWQAPVTSTEGCMWQLHSCTHLLTCQPPHLNIAIETLCLLQFIDLLVVFAFFCLCYPWLCWHCRNTVFNCPLKCTITLNLTVYFFLWSLQEELDGTVDPHCHIRRYTPKCSCGQVATCTMK